LDDAVNVQQYTDNGHDCQQWSLSEVGNGLFEIINRNSNLVLDADTGLPGDVNSDGNVDIVDALLIAQYYVGLITEFYQVVS
jgi:hypothetical protein